MRPDITVIDYGVGNLKSIQRAFEKVGANVNFGTTPDAILSATHLVLPGVGAFGDGMNGLRAIGVIDGITEYIQAGKPLLCICLGMQMLLDSSEEYGVHNGLGYIPGQVKKIFQWDNSLLVRKIPHIGWTRLYHPTLNPDWSDSVLSGISKNDYFYFIHSFLAYPKNDEDLLAESVYQGLRMTAAIKKGNVTGLQFHPEKSGECGLKVLDNFLRI